MPQSVSARAHRRHQVRVRIHGDEVERPRQPASETGAEYLARPYVEKLLIEFPRDERHQYRRVDETLVVRRDDVWPLGRQLFHASYLQLEKVAREEVDEASADEPEKRVEELRTRDRAHRLLH